MAARKDAWALKTTAIAFSIMFPHILHHEISMCGSFRVTRFCIKDVILFSRAFMYLWIDLCKRK